MATQQRVIISISCPNKEGWVAEFEEARKAVKKSKSSNRTAGAQLRLAIAARTLRQWEICQEACRSGLKLCTHSDGPTREKLLECQTQAKRELSVKSFVDDEGYKNSILPSIWDQTVPMDNVTIAHPIYSNLNILQFAALNGDVRLLEHVVALGASLDFPTHDKPHVHPFPGSHMAHKSSTALVLTCAYLALLSKCPGMANPFFNVSCAVECAVRLVMMGANAQVKFTQPPPEHSNMATATLASMDLYGKTAYELALISKHKVLIKALNELKTTENQIASCHCRCGSRLPWLDCHGFPRTGESRHYVTIRGGRLSFRYSPLAPCYCATVTNKTHFDCCWKQSADPHYQDDATGEFTFWTNMDTSNPFNEIFPKLSSQERQVEAALLLREQGPVYFRRCVSLCHGPKSTMQDWDLDVYVGTFERLGSNVFHWIDTHWQVDKVEILKRVNEWNTALAQYCDDVGLTGETREQVIQKHKANPCAPCANLSCTAFETKCKEFARCSRCKRVSYCSATFQRQHWKDHKKNCILI